jgi:hypothetical protein
VWIAAIDSFGSLLDSSPALAVVVLSMDDVVQAKTSDQKMIIAVLCFARKQKRDSFADLGLIYNEFLRFGRVKKFTQCSRIILM